MENMEKSLTTQQAFVSAPKIQEQDLNKEQKEREEAAKRFGGLSLGCFIYAVFYAFCMYQNKEGITFPFFVAATLYFFYYFTKKYWGIVKRNNRFFEISIILLGIITCTTATEVVILMNKGLILLLLCVMLLRTYHDVTGWSVGDYLCSTFYVICGSIGDMLMPLTDIMCFYRVKKESVRETTLSDETKKKVFAVLAGIVIGIPMLLFTGMMLSSADAYFASLFEEAFDFLFDFDWDIYELMSDVLKIGITILLMFLLSYGTILYINRRKGIEALVHKEKTRWDSYVAITFSALISIMYGLFVWVQIAGLFMGALTLPEGYTYAEYARQGFFQLVFVCLFNVCLVLICMSCFKKHKVLQMLLTVISLCTYVMLISSVYRMFLYIREYHLTFLRVFVLWAIVVIAVVMAGVIIAIYKERFPLFMYLLICVTSLYIGFAAMHPDYVIAKYNIAQKEAGDEVDEGYLRNELSMDAAAPIFEMFEKEGYMLDLEQKYVEEESADERRVRIYFQTIKEDTEGMNLRNFNFSKYMAKQSAGQFAESMK